MKKARAKKLESLVKGAEFKYFEAGRGAGMKLYDTTLRDGCQSRDVKLSVHDKLKLAKALDDYGVDYIELGWPGSNEYDTEVFKAAKKLKLRHAKITAFGSTRKLRNKPENDCNLKAIVKSGADVATIFGKTLLLHVRKQLKGTPKQNLDAITDSVQYLRKKKMEVIYDAEHFFDGFKDNKEYALQTLKAAYDGRASCLVLCDTKGGTTPEEIRQIVSDVQKYLKSKNMKIGLGIHCHDDSGLAVANTLEAAELGVNHIQATINGFGERAGNADMCVVVPNLVLKYKRKLNVKLKDTKKLSDLAYALTNSRKYTRQPFVGENAFNHKGGIHVDALLKIGPIAYEHIPPELVGQQRHVEWSNQAGRANLQEFAKSIGKKIKKKDPRARLMLKEVEQMYNDGYDLSLQAERMLLFDKYFGKQKTYFDVKSWKIMTELNNGTEYSECVMTGRSNGSMLDVVARVPDNGPVDAMFNALLKLVSNKYPQTKKVKLVNYKVRIAKDNGVESSVNVYIEYKSNGHTWATEGVSTNILEASLMSLMKGFRYYLISH